MRRSIATSRCVLLLTLATMAFAPFRTIAAPSSRPAPAPPLGPLLAPIAQTASSVPIESAPPPILVPPPPSLPASANIITDTARPATIAAALGNLPLAFVPNVGQTRDKRVEYQATSEGSTVYFRPDSMVLMLARRVPLSSGGNAAPPISGNKKDDKTITFIGEPVIFELLNANQKPHIRALEPLVGVVNYYIGSDPGDWHEGVSTFEKLIYDNVYPGVSLLYEGQEGSLKSTYVVAPGADPNAIRWRYRGLKDARLEADGSLHYSTTLTRTVEVTATDDLSLAQQLAATPSSHTLTVVEEKPTAWQERDGQRVPIDVSYSLANNDTASFVLGSYDASLPLFLDPTLVYTTYIGGVGSDNVSDIAIGPNNEVYITGTTTSNPLIGGAGTRASNDGYVVRLNATATQALYTTYISGSQNDQAFVVAVDQTGTAYVVGRTNSADLPITANAYDSTLSGTYDAFFSLIASNGTRTVLSYLGYPFRGCLKAGVWALADSPSGL